MEQLNNFHTLYTYLLIGSYLVGASSWAFLYREIRNLRNEVETLSRELAFERGKALGDMERRVINLERATVERVGR